MTPWLSSFEPQMTLLVFSLLLPKSLKDLVNAQAAKPLHPTSTGGNLAHHPTWWPALRTQRTSFQRAWKASLKQSSHGTVISSRTACLVDSDTRTIASGRVVAAVWLGSFSCCSRSANSCQFLAEVREPGDVLLVDFGWFPGLRVVYLEGLERLARSAPALIAPVMVSRTWSCLKQFCPLPKAFVQQLRMFSMGSSLRAQWACWWFCPVCADLMGLKVHCTLPGWGIECDMSPPAEIYLFFF